MRLCISWGRLGSTIANGDGGCDRVLVFWGVGGVAAHLSLVLVCGWCGKVARFSAL